jgi:quercetin dioxygenase-like cupin family protein
MMKLGFSGYQLLFLVIVVGVSVAVPGAVMATPGEGAVGMVVARGSFVDAVDLQLRMKGAEGGTEVIQVRGARDTVMQQIVVASGGHTGWHSHPGPAIVVVRSGALTLYSQEDPTCTGRTYTAGQTFIDPGQNHVHLARNESLTDSVEVWVTYFDVPIGQGPRIDKPDPGVCSF